MDAVIYNYTTSPLGDIELIACSEGLFSVKFTEINKVTKPKHIITECDLFTETKSQLYAYFNSELKEFKLQLYYNGTTFQKQVWQHLIHLPYAQTVSYLNLSKQLGDAKAIRAVANANAKNNLCIIVPCHRVIGTDGSLTGYAGDLWRKKWLLEHENSNKQTTLNL
jgi:methylated-DNA-[protein]-cysteine S-methyltransferase